MSVFRDARRCATIAAVSTASTAHPSTETPVGAQDARLIAGVSAPIARRLGIPTTVVRAGFVALALYNGIGIVGYFAAWVLLRRERVPRRQGASSDLAFQLVAIALLGIGAYVLVDQTGVTLNGGLLLPLVLLGIGGAILWHRTEAERRDAIAGGALRTIVGGRTGLVRLLVGGALVLIGFVGVSLVGTPVAAALVGIVGLGLIFGPWIWSLSSDYMAERRERIRSEERAEMAARLHDSVLQTLALIQRSADRPADTVRLARRQERELRGWLFGADQAPAAESLRAALEEMAADVEELHDVRVELVVVGEAPMTEGAAALVMAMREALVNAAKFSGETDLSAYAEVGSDRISAYVRDRGAGFDPSQVGPERHGITGSIIGRMDRVGGQARVHSAPDEGTEVDLSVPLEDT